MLMFNLSQEELHGRKILDCPAGACSFTAISNKKGSDVTATDIAYYHPCEQLVEKGFDDIEHVMLNMEKVQSNYLWDYFESVEKLKQQRIQALTDYSNHVKEYPNSYVPAILPVLPFKDNEFELTLSANSLFMYSDRFDYELYAESRFVESIEEFLKILNFLEETIDKSVIVRWIILCLIHLNELDEAENLLQGYLETEKYNADFYYLAYIISQQKGLPESDLKFIEDTVSTIGEAVTYPEFFIDQ